MGTNGRKLTLTVMVAFGVFIVWGLATGLIGVALIGTLGVALLALLLIWGGGPAKEDYRAVPVTQSGPRKHGGCLTWFVLLWIAFEVYVLVSSIFAPIPDDLVNWDALVRIGHLPVALHVFLSTTLALCRVGCLIGVWVWWRKWCVVGFLSAAGLDLVVEFAGRVVLGPPPMGAQSSSDTLQVMSVLLSMVILLVFVVLVWRERALFDEEPHRTGRGWPVGDD